MSKDKPEVGDVWKNKKYGNILYITAITNTYIDFIGFDKHDKFNPYFTNTFNKLHDYDRFEKFTEVNEYLGKSKVNINDLFEVNNE